MLKWGFELTYKPNSIQVQKNLVNNLIVYSNDIQAVEHV